MWKVVLILTLGSTVALGQSRRRPAPPPPDPLLQAAEMAADSWDFDALNQQVSTELSRLLEGDPRQADLERLTHLASVRQFAVRHARVTEPTEQDRAAAGLLALRPKLFRALMLASSDADAPDRVLAVLAQILADHDTLAEEYAQLVAALCVVFDEDGSSEENTVEASRARWLSHYFINAGRMLRFDPRQMPWQLLVWTVEVRVSQPEILWAHDRYGRRAIDGIYFDVPYDHNAYYQGDDRRIDAVEYNLANLTRFGGICTDQAYFATQVSRVLGVPAATIVGQGGAGGVGHAWVGTLTLVGREPLWNLSQGRYDAHLYWTGNTTDPQTRREISETHLAILAELWRSTPAQRDASVAIVRAIDLVAPGRRADWLMYAVDLSPGNRDAWLALADLAAARQLNTTQAQALAKVTRDFAAGRYPDFALDIYLRLILAEPNLTQIALLDELLPVFRQRTDLVARIRLHQAQQLRALRQDTRALESLGVILTEHLQAGPVVLEALAEVDGLLEDTDPVRLAEIYRQTWQRMPRPEPSAFARHTPFVQVGQRYQELLERLGRPVEARNVEAQLEIYFRAVGQPTRR